MASWSPYTGAGVAWARRDGRGVAQEVASWRAWRTAAAAPRDAAPSGDDSPGGGGHRAAALPVPGAGDPVPAL